MNYIKYLQNAGTITYANESRMPGYSHRNWYGGLVSGINGSRYSVHPGVYNFYTNEDGSISWGKRTGHIIKGSDGKLYVDFEVDPNSTARPELKTYLRFELGLTALKPQTPIVKLATEQEIIDPTLRKVSTSVPIQNLTPLNNQLAIILPLKVSNPVLPKSNAVAKLPALKPVTTKSTPIVKLPVPLNLLPYIANVTSNGVAFFNIPDGYTNDLFEEAIKAVYGLNKELALKPMVYYEQPQQLILQQKLQLLAVLLSLKLYLAQRQQITLRLNMKNNTYDNAQTDKGLAENNGDPDLVTEIFAYPSRRVHVYNIHPEAYLKVLEYLNKNYQKTETNNKPKKYVLSLSGFDKVPIGGEVNDSTYHYIRKDGNDLFVSRWYVDNANLININEPFSLNSILNDAIIDNGKVKMYSYSNDDKVYYKNSYGAFIMNPFDWFTRNKVTDYSVNSPIKNSSYLRQLGFTKLLAIDYYNKFNKNILEGTRDYNVDRSIFRPIEKLQPILNNSGLQVNSVNNSGLQTKSNNNLVLKAKQAGKKVLSFLGFLNGGTLNYLNYIN